MKTSLFNIIRGQKKIVNSFIFLISWSQIHAQANSLFLHNEERRPADKINTNLTPKEPQPDIFKENKIVPKDESSLKETDEDRTNTSEEAHGNTITFGSANINISDRSVSRLYRSDIKQGVIGKD